ncbi:protein of unknown function [Bacillus velezensis UCMB5033]|nr:protein of unknown function [Bacillus velezensis UCMB5033]
MVFLSKIGYNVMMDTECAALRSWEK